MASSPGLSRIAKVGVIGAGQMGAGIAHVSAGAGFETLLFDTVPGTVQKAVQGISSRLDRAIEKGALTSADKEGLLGRLKPAADLNSLSGCDLVIEAIVEDTDVKQKLFRELDPLLPQSTILATNTSSISITKLAAVTSRADRVIGLHFMNPVPVMKLVEVIRGLQTSDATYESSLVFVGKLQKTPVTARNDYPGFLVNRILIPMLNEAVFVLMEGTATPEEIDTAMKLGTNQPMGPLELADFVGLDTCLAICRILHRELGDDKYRPCPLLNKYVEAGWLGKKTGRGFYRYDR